ncbi:MULTISPECIES: superoxide dismutase family protein [Brevundimonas]|uniref:superoxide dismutase family protein n=1 Tax=Brevundimonas TaxID=41275 RepID=UPI001FD25748|nr:MULTISPECIES: superoxide dismutase family protein [Brevundimonas]MCZ4108625.1 superoxide dismutase family protein [Brevundimonas diminuta]WQE46896.1 superoxide dismutase family protein [Brevundimonas diminuta]HRL05654.1 superoxide dismutase family protein [Brevundimonas diminuta]HRL24214.1 superoxide dismutase family protein [Brevundimonas diminuta]
MAMMRATPGQTSQVAIINGQGADIGKATLTQGSTGLLIKVEATGLTPGWHGIHIHATGQCEAPFTSAGAHINHGDPKKPHGLLNAEGPDDGDLPNVFADAAGAVNAEVFTSHARLSQNGPGQWLLDADGSALVIHANADDHSSQPIGGAGDRVACAVIKAQ